MFKTLYSISNLANYFLFVMNSMIYIIKLILSKSFINFFYVFLQNTIPNDTNKMINISELNSFVL